MKKRSRIDSHPRPPELHVTRICNREMEMRRVLGGVRSRLRLRVRGALEWSYAVRDPGGCSRPRRVSETHRLISKDRNETPEEWTLVEALPIGAACPQRLDDLYAAVRAAGYSDAAQAVRNRMRVLLATVDGEHFPRNVATRLGHRDWM